MKWKVYLIIGIIIIVIIGGFLIMNSETISLQSLNPFNVKGVTAQQVEGEVVTPINYQTNNIDLGDGKFAQTSYLGFENYYNGTEFKPINTTLIPYNQDGYNYKSKEGIYSFYVKSNSNWGDGIKYCSNESGEYCLTYQAQDMSFRDIYGAQDYITSITGVQGVINDTKIKYTNAFLNTDLEYVTYNQMIKENFILKNLSRVPAGYLGANITLDFGGYIKYSNLNMYINNNLMSGNFKTNEKIEFRNNNITLFYLPKPYAYDSNGSSIELEYEVKTQGQQIWFYIKTPYSWLSNSSRVYPVYIDPDTGATSPGTMADDGAVGVQAWADPDNAKTSDNSYAIASKSFSALDSHYLKATNFGFSIPVGATINGILVEIEKYGFGTTIYDNEIKIVKSDGSIGTTNKAIGAWPGFDEYISHGASDDLWGETWASTDINDADFGVVIRASSNPAQFAYAEVDHIRITVYYTEGVSDTCTYTSGNWAVTCSDNCTISSNVNGNANSNFSISGNGRFTMNANLSGFTKYSINNGCSFICNQGCYNL